MAVLNVQVFALAPETAKPLTPEQQYQVFTSFTDGLSGLLGHAGPVFVMSRDVTPYDTGALVQVLCLADSGDTVTDTVAEHLSAAMAGDPEFFESWELAAGEIYVASSDN